MNPSSLLLIGIDAEARAVLVDAAQQMFPGVTVNDVPSIAEALQRPVAAGSELLLLGASARDSAGQAGAATDASGLPRWAIVALGDGVDAGGHATPLSPKGMSAFWVAQVLRSAVRSHALQRENERLRGDLLTIGRRISHDLRTPLSAIYTACDAINESLGDSDRDQSIFTQSITTSATELSQLIERVGSVIKASAEPIAFEKVAMGEVVFNTLQRVESRLLRKKMTVTQPKAWPKVTGVETWLEIIWLNLVANAVQHASGTPGIELGWSEAGGQFQFWADDRGPGVAPEKIGKLFQPFHTLHRLDAPRGLGLSLVERLVELQGGTCGHEPRAGGGAHFFFTLPAVTPPPPSADGESR